MGTPGAAGSTGPVGPSGVVATASMVGPVAGSMIAPLAGAFIFVGPTAQATVTATQRLTGAASIALAASAVDFFDFGLCYQLGAGTVTLLVGTLNYQSAAATPNATPFATSGTGVPGVAGTYSVGFCARNSGSTAITTDWLNAWVQVTN